MYNIIIIYYIIYYKIKERILLGCCVCVVWIGNVFKSIRIMKY